MEFGIRYKTGCRNCLETGIVDNLIPFANDKQVIKYKSLSGKELSDQIVQWRKQENKGCIKCGSSNEDILNVSINGIPIYDFNIYNNRLNEEEIFSYYQINFDKRNGNISIGDGGKMSQDDCLKSTSIIIDEVRKYSPNIFPKHPNGNFFCLITNQQQKYEIQVFRHHGFSKFEISDALDYLLNQLKRM